MKTLTTLALAAFMAGTVAAHADTPIVIDNSTNTTDDCIHEKAGEAADRKNAGSQWVDISGAEYEAIVAACIKTNNGQQPSFLKHVKGLMIAPLIMQ